MDAYSFLVAFLVLVLAVSLYYNFGSTRRLTAGKYHLKKTRKTNTAQIKKDGDKTKGGTGKRKTVSTQSDFNSSVETGQAVNLGLGSDTLDPSEDTTDVQKDDEEEQTHNIHDDMRSQEVLNPIFQSFVNEDELTEHVRSYGIFKGLCSYVADHVEDWKEKHVKIAIAGNSGTGKSSLINALRGIKPYEQGAAKVGVTEITTEAVSYSFPKHDRIIIYDLPGMGTIKFPRKKYMKEMKVSTYHAFIIVTAGRITENDVWFTKKIMTKNKHVFFVRTKIDVDVMNEKTDKPKGFEEKKCLAKMRDEITTNFKKAKVPRNCNIYLLSSRLKDQYDFPKLIQALQILPNITGHAIRKELEKHVESFICQHKELNKGGFIFKKLKAVCVGFLTRKTYNNMGKDLEEIRLSCLQQFNLDDSTLEEACSETEKPMDDLKAELRSFKHDEEKEQKRSFPFVESALKGLRFYHVLQYNLAHMCDDMASDQMHLVHLKLDKVEMELSPWYSD